MDLFERTEMYYIRVIAERVCANNVQTVRRQRLGKRLRGTG